MYQKSESAAPFLQYLKFFDRYEHELFFEIILEKPSLRFSDILEHLTNISMYKIRSEVNVCFRQSWIVSMFLIIFLCRKMNICQKFQIIK